MAPSSRVSVVLPAFQLGSEIAGNVRRVLSALKAIDNLEVVVVNDGSTDGTRAALAPLSDDLRVRIVHHDVNRGKGEALITGWKASGGDRVVFLDADLDLPPEQIPALLERLNEADVIVGTKAEAMAQGKYPPLRTFLSRIYSTLTSRLFRLPVDETQTGLKLFRREVLDQVLPKMRIMRYAFDLELLVRAHRLGFAIAPAPAELSEAAKGASFRPAMAWELARDTMRLAWWVATKRGF